MYFISYITPSSQNINIFRYVRILCSTSKVVKSQRRQTGFCCPDGYSWQRYSSVRYKFSTKPPTRIVHLSGDCGMACHLPMLPFRCPQGTAVRGTDGSPLQCLLPGQIQGGTMDQLLLGEDTWLERTMRLTLTNSRGGIRGEVSSWRRQRFLIAPMADQGNWNVPCNAKWHRYRGRSSDLARSANKWNQLTHCLLRYLHHPLEGMLIVVSLQCTSQMTLTAVAEIQGINSSSS